ncbi:uncharacterized protein HMPREF1541_04934 [Cyphellophora europaea CBS 101466]|uniref:Uncharacterized protein n=1 Tax=Cyphellophora europaea (strain CBS 101466) TaxID=1220924 RepID=W2RWF9_CYPE1|nr:uncharacterized protein HMPREF1541_04934 [Cyphellophora europaea CBS 101466]ETN40655.1 hypothetical protein HMPREF1541_04934 [Cyphellophora europaea CBS 101466]
MPFQISHVPYWKSNGPFAGYIENRLPWDSDRECVRCQSEDRYYYLRQDIAIEEPKHVPLHLRNPLRQYFAMKEEGLLGLHNQERVNARWSQRPYQEATLRDHFGSQLYKAQLGWEDHFEVLRQQEERREVLGKPPLPWGDLDVGEYKLPPGPLPENPQREYLGATVIAFLNRLKEIRQEVSGIRDRHERNIQFFVRLRDFTQPLAVRALKFGERGSGSSISSNSTAADAWYRENPFPDRRSKPQRSWSPGGREYRPLKSITHILTGGTDMPKKSEDYIRQQRLKYPYPVPDAIPAFDKAHIEFDRQCAAEYKVEGQWKCRNIVNCTITDRILKGDFDSVSAFVLGNVRADYDFLMFMARNEHDFYERTGKEKGRADDESATTADESSIAESGTTVGRSAALNIRTRPGPSSSVASSQLTGTGTRSRFTDTDVSYATSRDSEAASQLSEASRAGHGRGRRHYDDEDEDSDSDTTEA